MAADANGCFQNEVDEYAFVLNNPLLWDAVFNEFRYEPVMEYGSYRQVNEYMRTQILRWVRRQDFYWDEVLGLNEDEDIDKEDEDNVVAQPNVVEQPHIVVEEPYTVVEEPRTVVEEQVGDGIGLMVSSEPNKQTNPNNPLMNGTLFTLVKLYRL